MSDEQAVLLSVAEAKSQGLAKLIRNSHEAPIDLASTLQWDLGVDKTLVPKTAQHGWLYGTPLYGTLTPAQRHELLWLEVARDVSMFITVEQLLPVLYMGYINRYPDQLTADMHEYLMIFSKEEIVHTLMFKRYLAVAGLPFYVQPDGTSRLLAGMQKLPPAAGVLYTLLLEWVAELGAMHSTQTDEIDPLTRELFACHHGDEARHLAFGRWVSENYFTHASDEEMALVRGLVHGLVPRLLAEYTYNAQVALYTSFVLPVAADDEALIASVRQSEHNVALNAQRFAPMLAWLKKWKLM